MKQLMWECAECESGPCKYILPRKSDATPKDCPCFVVPEYPRAHWQIVGELIPSFVKGEK